MINRMPTAEEARRLFGLDPDRPVALIFGGSLGARSVNSAVDASVDLIAQSDFQVLWQRGKLYSAPPDLPENIKSAVFIDDMASAYAAADLVVSRSGATTVAELSSAGKPSVLVPLPTASNNEQESNARVLEEKGAAKMIKDENIGREFFPLVEELIFDKRKLAQMAQAAKSLARPDAAEKCAEDILRLVKAKKQISY
jgi:UDP-N-acetylglucosamine--N-acetylmuramyl-(pentapeptide) pyrophosphoryl-undecaprenol N-acetylglucosamine transferase